MKTTIRIAGLLAPLAAVLASGSAAYAQQPEPAHFPEYNPTGETVVYKVVRRGDRCFQIAISLKIITTTNPPSYASYIIDEREIACSAAFPPDPPPAILVPPIRVEDLPPDTGVTVTTPDPPRLPWPNSQPVKADPPPPPPKTTTGFRDPEEYEIIRKQSEELKAETDSVTRNERTVLDALKARTNTANPAPGPRTNVTTAPTPTTTVHPITTAVTRPVTTNMANRTTHVTATPKIDAAIHTTHVTTMPKLSTVTPHTAVRTSFSPVVRPAPVFRTPVLAHAVSTPAVRVAPAAPRMAAPMRMVAHLGRSRDAAPEEAMPTD
jgi:hypothetical protein